MPDHLHRSSGVLVQCFFFGLGSGPSSALTEAPHWRPVEIQVVEPAVIGSSFTSQMWMLALCDLQACVLNGWAGEKR